MKNCRLCSYCLEQPTEHKNEYAESFGLKGYDSFCKHPDAKLSVDENGNLHSPMIRAQRYTDYALETPKWCPMLKNLNNLPVEGEDDKTKIMEKNPYRKTYSETCIAMRKVPPITKIEDVEINQVYHCPPFRDEKRFDIFVLRKNNFHVYGRVLLDDGLTLGDPKYLYVSSDIKIKFLVKHKISDFNIKKIQENANLTFLHQN